jgi:hypothetical protein
MKKNGTRRMIAERFTPTLGSASLISAVAAPRSAPILAPSNSNVIWGTSPVADPGGLAGPFGTATGSGRRPRFPPGGVSPLSSGRDGGARTQAYRDRIGFALARWTERHGR